MRGQTIASCAYNLLQLLSVNAAKFTTFLAMQLQTGASTIQAQIERALSTIQREDRKVLGVSAAGRTDAGVHAQGQVGPTPAI